ncbi:hypothetical protein IW140_002269 [Coemansia sp. RSA 1813]|nr:hypothetical protein EV178_001779 [Coemansia sp. RSA 1646]KAJ1770907.1 hypothetical protein LPJ74_002803 [Coemansia sp. RSA 1843]KAJ2092908.1 hypothetical protein IW138_000621 [Coemansia sp. RSA 986]KAJ2216229.1 hypothetical protein EV179_001467 [Coemansia sp. RSA 487]KAJ2570597.1 hypothetical protein IW140_002269 [Coemansia sp. RSA 1813]
MDDFTIRLATDAAEAENSASPEGESSGQNRNRTETDEGEEGPSLGSMFGFAANWGRRLQNELHLDQLVDQVKKQSEEVTKAYKDDITEFAQAVRVGAVRGMDELSTRFGQIKTDLEAELLSNDDEDEPAQQQGGSANNGKREVGGAGEQPGRSATGLLQGIGKHFQMDALRQRQEKAKRLVDKLGTDLEDLLRDAIVIEAPGSASTEEQRSAARKIIYDRRMAQLAAIQESEDTYLVDPEAKKDATEPGKQDNAPNFATFIKDFDLESKQKEGEEGTTGLLKDNPAMAKLHKKLVPEKVEDSVFWTRYFFHAWLIDQEEMRRKKLVEAAVAATEEDQFSWDLEEEEEEEEPSTGEGPSKKEKRDLDTSEAATEDSSNSNAKAEKDTEADVEKTQHEKSKEKPAKSDDPPKANKGKGADDDDAWGEWE